MSLILHGRTLPNFSSILMMSSLFDTLQTEFCPPLDTSLLAALIADLDPNEPDIASLRTTLRELASHAENEHDLAPEHDSSLDSSPDFCAETAECSATSDSSVFSQQSFSSPLGFLQAALPHIPPSQLSKALSEADSNDDGDVDMESVVESLLTSEFIRELEERGLGALDGELGALDDELPWKRVENKKIVNGRAAKKKSTRGKTITLVDVRQRQHLPPPAPAGPPAPDPWTQLSSLSEHLATLLPPHPASFFQSHFHCPGHSSPAQALRTALSSITDSHAKPSSAVSTTDALYAMLDVLRDSPMCASLDAQQRSTLYSDAQLALSATRSRGDDAIDIVWLLLELELDSESGAFAMGVYHLPLSPLSPATSRSTLSPLPPPQTNRDRSGSASATMRQLPSGPPPVPPPPTSKRKCTSVPSSPAVSPTITKLEPFKWQTVPQKPPLKGPHPLALHIPAYDSANQARRSMAAGKMRGTGNGIGKGGKGDIGELTRADVKQRMAASLRKRDELLKEATKAWRRGNTKTRGGEVALYFAERAREFQELARREALNEARIMVESKRSAATDRNTIDLHGTSISEAVAIVREILESEGCSAANPLRIITGRGTHSANGVGVLKPAVRNAIVQDGWNVGTWDGGLVVRGRTSTVAS